uniref:Agamous-like MADS-box protein AGL29 n=1 Tax=Elaeis guineensis var. tenera TaxID=51953 RepID=A0A6I9S2X7_ELAGV|nr:agamous-like MADS-box protein AGL29 [Elaeis guineensis]
MATMPKKTMGRQKVKLKRIENEDALYVTFSKRKSSLFQKAAELATLCGSEIALVVFSPAGRPYSLGLPTVDKVFHRVLSSGPAQMGSGHSVVSHSAKQCSEITKHLEQEKSRKAILVERLQKEAPPRWEDGLHGLGWDDLLILAKEVEELKSKVDSRVCEILLQGASSSTANADAWPVGSSEGSYGVGPRGPLVSLGMGFNKQ